LRIFIDNYISDVYFKGKGAVAQKIFHGFCFTILGGIVLIASGFSFASFEPMVIFAFFLSGILAAVAGIPYVKALEIDNSTSYGIFMQIAPILYLILGWIFLGEQFTLLQLIAFVIVLSAPALIILSTGKRSRKFKIEAMFYAFVAVLISVIGNFIFVKGNSPDYNYMQEIGVVLLGKGIGNVIFVGGVKKWRKRFIAVYKKSHRRVLIPLICNCLSGFIKEIAYRGALVAAPAVAMASVAADASEPIVIFFMGIVLSLIWPKFGREKLNKKSVCVHLLATIIVVIGIILMQIQ
jgi:uncharacterized membrane protein